MLCKENYVLFSLYIYTEWVLILVCRFCCLTIIPSTSCELVLFGLSLEYLSLFCLTMECLFLTRLLSLGWEDSLEKGTGYGSSSSHVWIWELDYKERWAPKLLTPVFWPGELHGLYSLWSLRELDTTEWLSLYLWIWFVDILLRIFIFTLVKYTDV